MDRAAWAHLARRIGRRGGFLLFLAILDYGFGYSLLLTNSAHVGQNLLLPLHVWAVLWLAAGVNCTIGAFMRRDRIPFTISAAFKVTWAAVYAHLWITGHLTLGWVAVMIWTAFAGVTILIAGWPEAPPHINGVAEILATGPLPVIPPDPGGDNERRN